MKKFTIVLLILSFSVLVFAKTERRNVTVKKTTLLEKLDEFQKKYKESKTRFTGENLKPDLLNDLMATKADSIIAISSADTSLYRFSYEAAGRITSYFKCKKEGNKWINSYRNSFTYTSSGKLKITISDDGDGNLWVPFRRITLSYDAKDFLISSLTEDYDSTGWVNYDFYQYTNTSNGLVLTTLNQMWDKTAGWQNIYREENKYDGNWKLISSVMDIWSAGAWSLQNIFSYTYNQYGDLIEQVSDYQDFWTGQRLKSRITNTYDSKRQIIQELEEIYDNSKWGFSSRTTHIYEANYLVHKKIGEIWGDTSWVKMELGIDTLNQDKKLLTYYNYNWGAGNWVPYYRDTYKYNSKGNLLSLFDEGFADNKWEKYYLEEYTYDATGELLASYKGTGWENGIPVLPGQYDAYIYLNIDPDQLNSMFVYGYDIKIWYKKGTIPVELASFAGNITNGTVVLKWVTATETNNRGFDIERKSGSVDWQKIGSLSGAGTSAKQTSYLFEDKNIAEGKFVYRLKQIDFDGTYSYSQQIEINSSLIKDYSLGQNYPNPFNPSTVINYTLPFESKVKVSVYSPTGQLVKELESGVKEAGVHNIKFDASQLSSGVYFYSIDAAALNGNNSYRNTKKMLLLK